MIFFFWNLISWWPEDYTWSKNALKELKIERKINGLCTEIGPHDFRCDWGRVLDLRENEYIELLWQISPHRVPEPNPENGSTVKIKFTSIGKEQTEICLKHVDFQNHGNEYLTYIAAMDSEYGWEFILACFKKFVEK